MRLILASASPRRAELLRAAGFDFETLVANVDEQPQPGESPSTYVRRLAAEKSAAVQAGLSAVRAGLKAGQAGLKACTTPAAIRSEAVVRSEVVQGFSPADAIILGADTTVVVDGDILGKPRDDEESASMLRRLSGRRHEVLTGISIRQGAYELGRVETTAVWFAALTKDDIARYVASGEGRDKAGAYAIQGLASRFVPRIEGSYSNVVGLPVAAVSELVRSVLASHPETGYSDR